MAATFFINTAEIGRGGKAYRCRCCFYCKIRMGKELFRNTKAVLIAVDHRGNTRFLFEEPKKMVLG